jgi:hypothetical protein
MTAFNPGSGSTLKSTTVEAAIHEVALLIQIEEAAAREIDPTVPSLIAVNYFTGDSTTTITSSAFPVTRTIGTDGSASFKGDGYFTPTTTWVNNSPTLKATTMFEAYSELVYRLEDAEAANPEVPGRLESELNVGGKTLGVSLELDGVFSLSASGGMDFAIAPYLA